MRTGLLLAVPGLALLLLAAHLLHGGMLPLAVLALLLAGLLWVRRPWAARVVQVVLLLAAVEWALTAAGLAQMRLRHGEPYLRLVLILGAVTAFTLLAAYLFQRPRLRAWFGRPVGFEVPVRYPCGPVPGTPTFPEQDQDRP